MDVKALYPSILWQMAAKSAKEAIARSKLEWEEIDLVTLVRYLAVRVDREVIVKEGLEDVVPLPKGTTTLKSLANPKGKQARRTEGASQFYPCKKVPSKEHITKVIGLMVADCIETCMKNHFYTIGGEIRRQSLGGAIGSDLTGESARVYMMLWDKRYMKRLRSLGIHVHLYKRYVDDILAVLDVIRHGWKYDTSKYKMIYNKPTIDDMKVCL